MLILDAGTGIRRLAASVPKSMRRVDILLTHLHMDHIQGLGFFAPLYRPDFEVHIWGPGSATLGLQARLMRYLSPPLFPCISRSSRASSRSTRSRGRGGDRRIRRDVHPRVPSGADRGIPHRRGGGRRARLSPRPRARARSASLPAAAARVDRGRGARIGRGPPHPRRAVRRLRVPGPLRLGAQLARADARLSARSWKRSTSCRSTTIPAIPTTTSIA
jgi:Metal-dependent hydrolases of the beta-lactamase superfamily I